MPSSRKTAYKDAVESFQGDELAGQTFIDKYAVENDEGFLETKPHQMWSRMATAAALPEDKPDMWINRFFRVLKDFKAVPQGSIMFALGNKYQKSSCSNCFVLPVNDSLEDIFECAKEMARTYSYRGGVGVDISPLRPRDAKVENAAKKSTGAVSFMDLFSHVTGLIGQKNRRGALMITISDSHPDLYHPEGDMDFINIKRDLDKVNNANISVRITDEFMKAVKNGSDWTLSWERKDNVVYVGGKPIVESEGPDACVERTYKAREIWDNIVESATKSAEPGVIFWDRMKREYPSEYYEELNTVTTNPCSELPLPPYGACTLLSMNLSAYVKKPFTDEAYFDSRQFWDDTQIATRFLDNVKTIDAKKMPFEKQKEMAYKARRIGVGTHGLADMFIKLGLKYDSDEAMKKAETVYCDLRDAVYSESINLAREKGAFPLFNWNKHKQCPFIKRLPYPIKAGIQRYGMRNVTCLTIAPTGTVSLISQTSSGIEPIFRLKYKRRVRSDRGMKEYEVLHPLVQEYLSKVGEDEEEISLDSLPEEFQTVEDINWVKRTELQGTIQKYIDASISNCVAEGVTQIITDSGIFEIEELCSDIPEGEFGDTGRHIASLNVDNNIANISEGYNNGVSPTIKFECVGGYSLKATPNHSVRVLQDDYSIEWKNMNELKEGDYVVGRSGMNIWNSESGQVGLSTLNDKEYNYDKNTNSKDVSIPKRMSKKLARFLGYMSADGWTNKNSIGLSQQDNNVLDDFVSITESLFNVSVCIHSDPRSDNLMKAYVNSRELVYFCDWIELSDSSNTEVPYIVRRSGKGYVKEFIRGITLNGHITDQGVCITTSISRKYINQLQTILNNFGVNTTIHQSRKKGPMISPINQKEYDGQKAYSIHASGYEAVKFVDYIGFSEESKIEKSMGMFNRPMRKKLYGTIPNKGITERFREEVMPNINSNKIYESLHSTLTSNYDEIERDTLLMMNDLGFDVPDKLLDETYVFRKIKEIKDGGNVQTCDLSVPNGNSYIANGFVSHNTINIPGNIENPEEIVHDSYFKAWEEGCKGYTVYVDGSRDEAPLEENDEKSNNYPDVPECPVCETPEDVVFRDGCHVCSACGWEKCSV